jgi:hypothetical protein
VTLSLAPTEENREALCGIIAFLDDLSACDRARYRSRVRARIHRELQPLLRHSSLAELPTYIALCRVALAQPTQVPAAQLDQTLVRSYLEGLAHRGSQQRGWHRDLWYEVLREFTGALLDDPLEGGTNVDSPSLRVARRGSLTADAPPPPRRQEAFSAPVREWGPSVQEEHANEYDIND